MSLAVDPVSVDAELSVTIDGRECDVWTAGETVVVNAPSLRVALALLDGVDALPMTERRLVSGLRAAALVVEVRVRYATVAMVGAGVESSVFGALTGYDAAVSPRGVLAAAWRALG